MVDFLRKLLSPEEIESLEREIIAEAPACSKDAASRKLQGLRQVQRHQPAAAKSLVRIVSARCLPIECAVEILSEIVQFHDQAPEILAAVAECFEIVRDIDDLNAPPPVDAVFYAVVDRLVAFAKDYDGRPEQEAMHHALSQAARMLARQRDEAAERSYRKLVAIDPRNSAYHYNLGLFQKTRGRFEEGMKSNQIAASLVAEAVDRYEWNLGICATGAGNASVALGVWRRMGHKIEIGRFGLPEGEYRQCKVKLAERPLAERTAQMDDPGLDETIWIERLSPCHGIIRSVLYGDVGVDYGDVILIDGAPITYHTYGDAKVPVFPHLATLRRQNYQFFDFAGTQDRQGQLADASVDLDGDTIVYPHSENLQRICDGCWRDPDLDHQRHEAVEKHVVVGRIAAAPHVDPARLLDQLDRAVAKRGHCQLYAPGLSAAAGDEARSLIDGRRFDLLTGN